MEPETSDVVLAEPGTRFHDLPHDCNEFNRQCLHCQDHFRLRWSAEMRRASDEANAYAAAFEMLWEVATEMRGYVPEYFAEKWNHDDEMQAARAAFDEVPR